MSRLKQKFQNIHTPVSKVVEHFQDVVAIKSKMTPEEFEWYRNFGLGLYAKCLPRLKTICTTEEQYQYMKQEALDEGNVGYKRTESTGKQRAYTQEDWAHRDTVYVSFEDALIDAIDAGISIDSVIGFEKINIQNQETRQGTTIENDEGDDE